VLGGRYRRQSGIGMLAFVIVIVVTAAMWMVPVRMMLVATSRFVRMSMPVSISRRVEVWDKSMSRRFTSTMRVAEHG